MSRLHAAALVLGAALGLAAAGCGAGDARTPLHFPARLAGIAIVDSIAGEPARATLQRMHGKGVAPEDTRIGVYGRDALPTLVYLSRYPDAGAAAAEARGMATSIGDGSSGFVARRRFRVDGIEIHEVAGHGQAHYYFARGDQLAWLSAPPELAPAMLGQLLRLPPGTIPR